ncbi:MAG: sigma-70 family RNA polymerase sigma factor [Clostridiales bacterium]|nr:sigma-70 family RNA polymerase sigma factor [Clostridiales bacterium]
MKRDKYDIVVEHILDHQAKSYRIAYSYVSEKEAALDIVQNAICRALENYRNLRNVEAVQSWYYRILVNEAIQYIRKQKREISCEPQNMKEEVYVEHAYEPGEEVYRKVCELPEQMKTVVMLHYFEQMTLKEIAEVTGANVNTVKTRLYTALKRLRTMVEIEDGKENG